MWNQHKLLRFGDTGLDSFCGLPEPIAIYLDWAALEAGSSVQRLRNC